MFPRLGKVMGAENSIEVIGENGNRSIGMMLQCCVQDNVRARCLADVETPDGFVKLVRIC